MAGKRTAPVPRPKPKLLPKSKAAVEADGGSASVERASDSRRGPTRAPRSRTRRHNDKQLVQSTMESSSNVRSMMPSLHPSLVIKQEHTGETDHADIPIEASQDNSNGKNLTRAGLGGDLSRDESTSTHAESTLNGHSLTSERRRWENIEEIRLLKKGILEPLSHPFVPENYDRIDRDGVRRIFGVDTAVNSCQHDSTTGNSSKKCILVQLPAQLPLRQFCDSEPVNQSGSMEENIHTKNNTMGKKDTTAEPVILNGVDAIQSEEDSNRMEWVNPLPNPFSRVGPGRVGRITVHKSGKAFLHLGNIKFDVSAGFNVNCVEGFYSISSEKKSCVDLGEVFGHVVVTPSLDCLLGE